MASSSQTRSLLILCISLHVLLVLLHVVLIIIYAREYEHIVVVNLDVSSTISTRVVFATQFFIIAYTAILLIVTQRVTVWSLLASGGTLTTAHDVFSAWSGLGSALLGLWRQISLPASVVGTSGITLYLASISALHISTPAIFSMETFNQTDAVAIPTTKAMPQFDLSLINSGNFSWDSSVLYEAPGMLQYLEYTTPSIPGLTESTVYDILDENDAVGNVIVEEITSNVTCGFLSNVSVTDYANTSTWYIESNYLEGSLAFWIYNLTSQSLQAVNDYRIQPLGRYVTFAVTFNVTDADGTALATVINDYPVPISFVGCTLAWRQGNITVDASTRTPTTEEILIQATESTWAVWMPNNSMAENAEIDSWLNFFLGAGPSEIVTSSYLSGNETAIIYASVVEMYIMDALGLQPGSSGSITTNLTQFESALNNVTAALYWSAGRVAPKLGNSTTGRFALMVNGQAYGSKSMSRLNFNPLPVFVGLGTSVILTALAVYLTRSARPLSQFGGIEELGGLQFSWLAVHNENVSARLAEVDTPEISTLRSVGMTEITTTRAITRKNGASYTRLSLGDQSTLADSSY